MEILCHSLTVFARYIIANEKGGNVDFVAPDTDGDDPDEDESEGNEERRGALAAVRSAIHEYQEVREQIKLLSDFSNNQN